MSKKRLRIAFIGAGDHARRAHAKHFARMTDDVSVVAVADPSREAFRELQREYGRRIPHWHADEHDVLANKDVDAVLISSPDQFHLDQLRKAVLSRKHVFCEKPMADSLRGLGRLQLIFDEAQSSNLVVTSCHPRRFDRPYMWLKNNLARLTHELGQPVELKLDFMYHQPSKTGLHGGSMLQDHMNHEFDYMNFLLGSSGCTAHKLHDEEDRYHVAGKRDDGVVFSFGGTRRLNRKTYAEAISLRFEGGLVFIDTYNPENSYVHNFKYPSRLKTPIEEAGKTNYNLRFRAVNQNWISTIAGTEANYLTPKEMIANTYMSVAFQDQVTVRYDP